MRSVVRQTSWVFARGDERVTLEVTADPAGLLLTVHDASGACPDLRRFQSADALLECQMEYRRTLLSRGFRLRAVVERGES
jgi:hypothetical protein